MSTPQVALQIAHVADAIEKLAHWNLFTEYPGGVTWDTAMRIARQLISEHPPVRNAVQRWVMDGVGEFEFLRLVREALDKTDTYR